ncbi:lysylphosphatidylglycerol synthase transmembrane domain-containing protein [Agrobacterium sp. ES01]|uniref:lysylphosphatidylglycerol synthase transmembrane domain-containing protein n=1 Tax=Agrobacterium sp. ES01 TaxID=3420714 RepID=UPI003D0B174C
MNLKFAIPAILICAAILAALIAFVEPESVLAAFREVPITSVVAALIVVQVQIVLSAVRWRFTAKRLDHQISLSLAIREYYVSSLLNQLLPGGMAGDAFRAYRNRTDESGGWKRPATAVLLERLSGQVAFFFLIGLGLFAWPLLLSDHLPDGFAVLVWIFVSVLVGCATLGTVFWRSNLFERFRRLKPDLAAVFWQGGALRVQVGLSVLIVAGYVATFLIASDAVGATLPVVAAMTAIPLCLLTMLIPAGVGGWGTREAAAAALWPLFGFTSAQGLSASLLYGLLSIAGAALPGLFFIVQSLLRGRIGQA